MCHDFCKDCPLIPESHTTKEWAEMPDKVSVKNKWYAVTDYRTDNEVNIPRFKFGDGVTKKRNARQDGAYFEIAEDHRRDGRIL